MPERRYAEEEYARRGTERYERDVRPLVEAGNNGKIVAIDIETGDYEVGEELLAPCERLLTRHPEAQIWCVRIGYPAVRHFLSPSRAVRT